MKAIRNWVFSHADAFFHLFLPYWCYGCEAALDEGEANICDHCQQTLPLTHHWRDAENEVQKLFWGKVNIQHAGAMCYFTKGGRVQRIVHALKYDGRTDAGLLMGCLLGKSLLDSDWQMPDAVVAVPLHKTKKRRRGYNQCDFIARGVADAMGLPVVNGALLRLKASESQTRKGVYERWLNVKELFRVATPDALEGKHLLLVDDVVTTGATIEACAGALLLVPGVRVSVAALACPSPV